MIYLKVTVKATGHVVFHGHVTDQVEVDTWLGYYRQQWPDDLEIEQKQVQFDEGTKKESK